MNKGYASIFSITALVFSLLYLPAIPSSSTAHTVYLSSPLNGSFRNVGNSNLSFIYNHTGDLSGVVNCTLYIDDQAVNYTKNVSANISIPIYSNISWNESQHSWYVNCTNGTAQESSITFYNGSWIFTADFTPPSVTINEPTNTTYNSTNITLSTTITDDNLNICWYSLDNWSTNIFYNCSSTTINASDGSKTLRIGVNDSAGNLNNTESVTFTVDTNPPTVTLNVPADNYTNNTADPVDVTFNCSANDSVGLRNLTLFVWNAGGTVYNMSTSDVGGTSNTSAWIISLVNGNYTWNCQAYDSAGLAAWEGSNKSITINYSGPVILDTAVTPYSVINGSNLTLYISAINVEGLWASIIKPDASHENINLTNNANTPFTNTTLTGRYNVTFYVNDSHGTMVNTTNYFESFPPLTFNFTITNHNNAGVNSTWTIYYRNETVAGNNSENGSYSQQIPNTLLDMEIKAYVNRLRLFIRKIIVSSENNRILGIDKRATPVSGFLVTYGINNNYSFTNATLLLYYDNLNGSYTNESNLRLHKCGVWNFTSQTCTGNWTDITNDTTQNMNSHLFSYVTTSFSGFSINESVTTTTTTTTTTVTTTVSRSGGNGGGGGGGGGFSAIAVTKATCFDGLRNCHDGSCEDGVDCGGPCKPCPSCSDRIQNQGEEGIDCGGPCDPCGGEAVTTTTTQITETTSTITTSTSTTSTTIKTGVTLPPTSAIIAYEDTSIRDSGIMILGLLTLLTISLYLTKKEKRKKEEPEEEIKTPKTKTVVEQRKARAEEERRKEEPEEEIKTPKIKTVVEQRKARAEEERRKEEPGEEIKTRRIKTVIEQMKARAEEERRKEEPAEEIKTVVEQGRARAEEEEKRKKKPRGKNRRVDISHLIRKKRQKKK